MTKGPVFDLFEGSDNRNIKSDSLAIMSNSFTLSKTLNIHIAMEESFKIK